MNEKLKFPNPIIMFGGEYDIEKDTWKFMAQQTAVSWVIEQLRQLAHNPKTHLGMGDVRVTQGYLDELKEQAKQMEREQKEECWNVAHQAGRFEGKGIAEENWQTFEQYYNETYKQQ